MDRERTLQVVLGEAEPEEGFLRFVLEGEGFDIVGMASTDAELERVLRGARPDVIVLDAGISARAALEAKEQANGAALVVIWPSDVVAAIADEHVEPHLVVDDLGPAVRTASLRARPREERVDIPDTIGEVIERWREAERVLAPAAPPEEARPESPRLDRSSRGVLIAALTWILVLTTLATIAVGVPKALDVFAGRSPGQSSHSAGPSRPSTSPSVVSGTTSGPRSQPSRTRPCGNDPCSRRSDPKKDNNGKPAAGKGHGDSFDPAGGTPGEGAIGNGNGAPPAEHPGQGESHGKNVEVGSNGGGAAQGGLKERRQGTGSGAGSSDVVVSIA